MSDIMKASEDTVKKFTDAQTRDKDTKLGKARRVFSENMETIRNFVKGLENHWEQAGRK
jgi:hypothetical protein